MVSSVIAALTYIFPTIFGIIYSMAINKQAKLGKELEELAPDLKPVYTPSQEAAVKANALRAKIIGGILGLTFTVIFVLTIAIPEQMMWGTIYVDPNSDLYTQLQIAGLATLAFSWFVEWRCMKAFSVRADYLKNYYANPKGSRPPRSVEEELTLLKRFPYNFWREPLAMSFHWLSVSTILLSQSWFIAILQALVILLNEMLVIQNDNKWRSWFLTESYDRYFDETGSQWSCLCLNNCNRKVIRMREEKFARLAEFDGEGAVSGKVRVDNYGGKEEHVAIAVQRSNPYTN